MVAFEQSESLVTTDKGKINMNKAICDLNHAVPWESACFDSLWANLTFVVTKYNHTDGRQVSEFITKLDWHQNALLHSLPFDSATITMITQLIMEAVRKIYKLRAERLRKLEAS